MLLRLSPDQLELLEQLTVRQQAQALAGLLAEAWPAVTERLKDRWPTFVEAAMQQARLLGLADPTELARYTGLWCLWGASFEDKPGFEWAREIVADARRSPALKLHQLVQRSRVELQPRSAGGASAGGVTLAQFDASLERVDAGAARAGARAVFPPETRLALPKTCDIAAVDLQLVEPALQTYVPSGGSWPRQPTAAAPRRERLTQAPDAPFALAVLSHPPRGGGGARLNLRVESIASCDPREHPTVVHSAPASRLEWKGRDVAQLSLQVAAEAPPPGLPGVGAPALPKAQRVAVASCGVRDAGAPFGPLEIALDVYPATQWYFELRHGTGPTLTLPGGEAPAPAAVACRLEADGQEQPTAEWRADWTKLQRGLAEGLEKLFNAWLRNVTSGARLEAQCQAMAGEARFTWGPARRADGSVFQRTEAMIDLVGAALDLHLHGLLAIDGMAAQLTLSTQGEQKLQAAVLERGDPPAEGQALADAVRSFRWPLALSVESLHGGEPGALHAAPQPEALLGAVTGECGLRPRADARGMQWFFTLRVEPSSARFTVRDPITGASEHQRTLLPAMTLVDWSAG